MNPAPTLRLVAVAAAITCLALSACATSAQTADATTTSRPSTASPLCTKGVPTERAVTGLQVMRSRGTGWAYHQDVPPTYDGTTPAPMAIVLGDQVAPDSIRATTHADVVVLEVAGPVDGGPWTSDDQQVRFVDDLVLRAETQLCFDRARVYVTGVGAGDVTAHTAVRELPDTLQLLPS